MTGGRIAVIGGSIAGCAAALAVHRAGAEVTVFERSPGGLEDRGVGISMHSDLCRQLEAAGYLDPGLPYLQLVARKWITRDGEARGGRVVGTQPFDFRAYNWGSVWQSLRDRLPAEVDYRAGSQVARVTDTGNDVVVTLADGTESRFDGVLGADGYRSIVRSAMLPEVRPRYAGYLLWRGTVPLADLPDHCGLWRHDEAVVAGFPGGHLVLYLIPGRDGRPVLNWAAYAVPSAELDLADPTSLPPGALSAELFDQLGELAGQVPPYWGEVLRGRPRERVFAQPIYDLLNPACAAGRLGLAGDAAAVARPHSGGGMGKALQDATTLESVLNQGLAWADALRAYDQQRAPVNTLLVGLGRSLGSATVTDSPDWPAMDQAGFDDWWLVATGQRKPATVS